MDQGQAQPEKPAVPAGASAASAVHLQAYRDDMGDSYGAAYTTRSADEGYGERYGEAVKKVLDNKAQKEEHLHQIQNGTTADRDQATDAGLQSEYDRTQGHPVAQKEDSRHFTNQAAQ